jgi:type 1 glutamine amidotransferase
LIGDRTKISVIATAKLDGKDEPEVWTFQKGKGRVFGCVLGHFTWTQEDPFYRILVLRGTAWVAGRKDAFSEMLLAGEKAH